MLLLGRNFSSSLPLITEASPTANVPLGLWQYVKDIFTTWWTKWEVYVLPNLFPNKKWKTPCPNIKARDVCLLHKNLGKHSVASYKYCKVIQAKPELDKLVCKTVVTYFNIPSMKTKRREIDI